jgi:hypothetical protein
MSHFAMIKDKKVVQVIKARQEFIDSCIVSEPIKWVQTSYNTRGGIHYDPNTGQPSADQSKAFRKNYAGIGYSYDKDRDAFIPPKPFPSWTLNETSCLWEAPVAMPTDGKMYSWDEDSGSWKEATAA